MKLKRRSFIFPINSIGIYYVDIDKITILKVSSESDTKIIKIGHYAMHQAPLNE